MSKVKIIADSTCDLSQELIEKYNIDIIPLYIQLDEKSYLDKIEITPEQIYEWSDRTGKTPKTAAPGIEIVQETLEKYKNDEVIYFGISEEMSTTCNVVRLVAEDLECKKVYVINSKNLSTGIALQVLRAAELAEQGKTAEEIVKIIEPLREKVRSSFVIDTLTYLHRGGRCNAMTAMMAGALKLKPMISVMDGKMDVTKKYRGTISGVIKKYGNDLEEELKQADATRVFITHSGCSDEIINQTYEYLKSLNHFKEIHITKTGSVIASHCGPNTLGILFCEAE